MSSCCPQIAVIAISGPRGKVKTQPGLASPFAAGGFSHRIVPKDRIVVGDKVRAHGRDRVAPIHGEDHFRQLSRRLDHKVQRYDRICAILEVTGIEGFDARALELLVGKCPRAVCSP
jgi:hypothetical protein